MAIVKVNDVNFEEEVLNADVTVLADFYADWCGPCKMLHPTIEEIANERTDIKVVEINVDDAMELAGKYGVSSIPALKVFKGGEVVNSGLGFMPKDDVLKLVD